jgi:putative hydrolase of the HAD superfamily
MKYSGLLFDLDGTLFDSDRIYSEALKSVGVDPEGSDYKDSRAQVKMRLGEGHVCARNRLLYFKRMLERKAGTCSPRALLDLMDRYEKSLAALIGQNWHDLGRPRLLDELAARYPLVVLTNENTRTQMIKLRMIDPDARWFGKVLTSEEWGVEKPAPKLFQAALQAIGHRAADCLMIGDDLESDITPALKAGLGAVWTTEFKPTDALPPSGARKVSRLDELRGILLA